MAKKRKRTKVKTGLPIVDSSEKVAEVLTENNDMRNALCGETGPQITEPTQVRITNRRKRLKNMFLADAVRDQNDQDFLNKEISKREYKGKLKTITTIKHCDPIDGEWVTEFIIDLKE